MLDDKGYKQIINLVTKHQSFYIGIITKKEHEGMKIVHNTWLRLMGLLETWDISRYDR